MEKKPKYEIRNLNQGNTPYRRNIIYCELYKDGEMFASCDVAFVLQSHDISKFENGNQVLREYVSFVSERLKGEDVDFDGEKFELASPAPQPTYNYTSSNGQLNSSQIEAVVKWMIVHHNIPLTMIEKFKEDFSKHLTVKDIINKNTGVEWKNDSNEERPAVTPSYQPLIQTAPPYVFTHGQRFKAKYQGTEVEGKVYIDERGTWLDKEGGNGLFLKEGETNPQNWKWSDLILYPLEEATAPPATSSNTEDEIWTLTNQLKWTKHYIDRSSTGEVDLEKLILQQLHQSNKGKQKWIDVPTE